MRKIKYLFRWIYYTILWGKNKRYSFDYETVSCGVICYDRLNKKAVAFNIDDEQKRLNEFKTFMSQFSN